MDRLYEELRSLLARFNQQHVLAFWKELAAAQREELAEQIQRLDMPGLEALMNGTRALEDWAALARRAVAPPAIRLDDRRAANLAEQAHRRGTEALTAGHVGAIVVAGGQGTRLGFDQPKGLYSIGPVSGNSLIQILFEKVAARARGAGMRIRLYLMTSPATHSRTATFLETHEYFGLPREDVRIFCQGTMPAVEARTGRLLLEEKHRLALSPDGHGGTLAALEASGCLADIRARGLRQLFYCQVDNPLVQMCDPEFIGHHLAAGSELSTQVVAKRTPRDKVGNVVSLDGRLRIIEYSELNSLDDDIVTRTGPDGRPVFWAGNTAVHVFDVAMLERASHTAGALPFHVAQKAVPHIDPSGRRVNPQSPNAFKFERFIFDLLPEARQAIVVEVDEAREFAPLKNAPGDSHDTPQSVQQQMIALHAEWLRAAGCEVVPGVPVEISPMFAQNAEELAAQVRSGMVVTQARYFC